MRDVDLFCFGSDISAILFMMPECLTPSLTKKRMPTVSIPLFEKPATISLGVIIPIAIKKTATENNTNPGRIASLASANIITTITINTM